MTRRRRTAEAPVDADWVCLGTIGAPKGVRGALRVTCFTEEPENVAAYGPVHAGPGGPALALTVVETLKANQVVVRVAGVEDRDAAARLTGTRLCVRRDVLPAPWDEDEFYNHDLVGLAVESEAGERLGRVRAMHDFGAGALVEIAPDGGGATVIWPFTREVVPVVDLGGGRLVAVPPAETPAHPDGEGDAGDDR